MGFPHLLQRLHLIRGAKYYFPEIFFYYLTILNETRVLTVIIVAFTLTLQESCFYLKSFIFELFCHQRNLLLALMLVHVVIRRLPGLVQFQERL